MQAPFKQVLKRGQKSCDGHKSFPFPSEVRKKETLDNKSHRDGKRGFVCLLVLGFQRALTNIFPRERSHDNNLTHSTSQDEEKNMAIE